MMREMTLPKEESCMFWGCTIPKGWRWILDDCLASLEVMQRTFGIKIIFKQIKEKCGDARFYRSVENVPEEDGEAVERIVKNIINTAEEKCSYYCCETGEPLSYNKNLIKTIGFRKYSQKGYELRCKIFILE